MLKIRLHAIFILVTVAFVVATVAAESRYKSLTWIESNGKSCAESCTNHDLFPVESGKYKNNHSFYVCSANPHNEGYRAGYNVEGDHRFQCMVEYGHKESFNTNHYCLCNPTKGVVPIE